MPKLPRLTAEEAEKMLLKYGFRHVRSRGSHRIYQRDKERFILPFHSGKTLHPKITKALFELIEDKNGQQIAPLDRYSAALHSGR